MDNKGISWYIEEWPKLLDREEVAFQYLCSINDEKYAKTHKKSKATKEWWLLVNAILWMQIRTKAQLNHDLHPPPFNMLGRMANIAEELSSGLVSTIISDVSTGGRPLWRAERHDIGYGVAYMKAVERGELEDKSPNKTVRQAYGVTAKAVQRWVRREQEICVGVPFKHLSPQQLKDKMLESGARYSKIGRGAPSDN